MEGKVRLERRPKGFALVEKRRRGGDRDVVRLSGMDAAYLLFQIKDMLRVDPIMRSCIDRVHWLRTGRKRAKGHPLGV